MIFKPSILYLAFKRRWASDYPLLSPVVGSRGGRPRNSNYVFNGSVQFSDLVYFFSVNSDPVRLGEFTIAVTISDSIERTIIPAPVDLAPSARNIGGMAIAQYIKCQRYVWAVRDVDAYYGIPYLRVDGPNIWRPSRGYDVPLDEILDEAITDVNSKLEKFVFPVLGIDPRRHVNPASQL